MPPREFEPETAVEVCHPATTRQFLCGRLPRFGFRVCRPGL